MCDRLDDFTPGVQPGGLGTDPTDPLWQDADPPQGKNVTVYYFANVLDELRVIIKQGGAKVADFYTQDAGVNSARMYTSPGGAVEYEISRCEGGNWMPYIMTVGAPTALGNFRISEVKNPIAKMIFATRLS
jgi:hypothetical protein